MKIAIIGSKGIPCSFGGVERYTDELATRLVKFGHEVLVYCRPWYSQRKRYQGVKLVYLPSLHTKHLDTISHTFLSLWDALWRQKVDILHIQGVGPALLTWLARLLRPKTKVVVTFHCRDSLHQKWGWLARRSLSLGEWMAVKIPQATIAVSRTLQEYCFSQRHNLVFYIPNGITRAARCQASLLSKFGLRPQRYLLTVCRLIPHKGVHYLIQAFNRLDNTNFKLVIVGEGSYTNDYTRQLRVLAGNNPSIVFTGNLDYQDLAAFYTNAYLYIQPSETEGLSLSLLEAQGLGCPALVSDIPENKEAIGSYGFTFKSTNMADLSKKLAYLLVHKDLVTETGLKAKQRVRKTYNWDKIARQTERLYEIVMRKG